MNMLTERAFDEAHREATGAIIESMFTVMSSDIAADRGVSAADFAALVDRGPYLGAEAVDAGLVDGLAYRDEVFARVEELSGGAFETLSPSAYLKIEGGPHDEGTGVALIYGNGGVQRGQSSFDPLSGSVAMGSDTVTRAFRDALEDDDVKAILFRVDSPGGSYVASDAIWRMTVKAREAGKPVVVSMGNVAASGGYFVSMASDRIIAQPGTVTGSIGVVGGKFLTRDFWEENFGITWDTVQTSANAGMYVGLHDYTEEGWARYQAWLDRVYDDFTGKVARGRGMSREASARGRQGPRLDWRPVDRQRLGGRRRRLRGGARGGTRAARAGARCAAAHQGFPRRETLVSAPGAGVRAGFRRRRGSSHARAIPAAGETAAAGGRARRAPRARDAGRDRRQVVTCTLPAALRAFARASSMVAPRASATPRRRLPRTSGLPNSRSSVSGSASASPRPA
jgi:signal peptide peptidase SppA